jgi:hypothetical protein
MTAALKTPTTTTTKKTPARKLTAVSATPTKPKTVKVPGTKVTVEVPAAPVVKAPAKKRTAAPKAVAPVVVADVPTAKPAPRKAPAGAVKVHTKLADCQALADLAARPGKWTASQAELDAMTDAQYIEFLDADKLYDAAFTAYYDVLVDLFNDLDKKVGNDVITVPDSLDIVAENKTINIKAFNDDVTVLLAEAAKYGMKVRANLTGMKEIHKGAIKFLEGVIVPN